MLNRHQSREVVVQALFNLDFRKASKESLDDIYNYVLNEFYAETKEDSYSWDVFHGVLEKQEKIDEIIVKTALNWSLDKIDPVDRNILRLGIFEMLFSEDVPPRVAMNEAIELAKTFGGKNSFKFISGVLGTIYEVSDLEKDQRNVIKNKKLEDLPLKKKYGALVFSEKDGVLWWAFLYDIFGYWTLPKGSGDENNSGEDIAKQKVQEEMGIEVVILDELGKVSFPATDDDNNPIRKEVTYFLARGPFQDLILDKENKGLIDIKWVRTEDIDDLKKYKDLYPLIKKGIKLAKEKYVG